MPYPKNTITCEANESTLCDAHMGISTVQVLEITWSAIVQKSCTPASFTYFEYSQFRLHGCCMRVVYAECMNTFNCNSWAHWKILCEIPTPSVVDLTRMLYSGGVNIK